MKWLIVLLSIFLPQFTWAQTTTEEAAEEAGLTFEIPDTDVSVNLLGNIFGYVDGVLHGTGSQIIGTMFGVFNAAVLALGMFVLAYTTIVGVLKTAAEGSVLGKQWSSIWVPIKSALGVALLIPKASGYCALQILVMFIVLQGIGVADAVWKAALGYLASGGVIIQQSESAAEQDADRVLQAAGSILASQVCMHSLEDQLQKYLDDGKASSYTVVPAFNSTVAVDSDARKVEFPGDLSAYEGLEDLRGVCGQVTWEEPAVPEWVTDMDDSTLKDSLTEQIKESKEVAVYQMVLDLDPYAQQVVQNSYRSSDDKIPLGYFANADTVKDTSQDEWGSGDDTKSPLLQGRELNDAAADYLNIMFPAQNALSRSFSDIKFIGEALSEGWIMAGKYYFDLAALNTDADNTKDSNNDVTPTPPPPDFTDTKAADARVDAVIEAFGGEVSSYVTDLNNLVNNSDLGKVDSASYQAPAGTYLGDALAYEISYGYVSTADLDKVLNKVSKSYHKKAGKYDFATKTYNSMVGNVVKIAKSFFGQLMYSQAKNTNPVTSIAKIGAKLVTLCIGIWVTATALTVAGAVAAAAAWGFTFSIAASVATGWIVPLLLAPVGALIAAGFIMMFYIPLVPFIVFTFAAIGWFIAVIEAMAAAPIVAMGIIWPEGHEVFGKAEQALLILVNVFIRPSLMVIGLFFGIILSYAMIWLLNYGFFYAFFKGLSESNLFVIKIGVLGLIFVLTIMIITYLILCIMIIQKSFSLIHILPDRVMRWLGAPQEAYGGEAAQVVEQARGAMGAAGQTVGGGAEKGGEAAARGGIQEGAKAAKDKKDKDDKDKDKQDKASQIEVGKQSGGGGGDTGGGGQTPPTGGG